MNGYTTLPSIQILKNHAKRLRTKLEAEGHTISHSNALELLAHQHGYKDWNTLCATTKNNQAPINIGEKVNGQYLGQAFRGEVIKIQKLLDQSNNYRITLLFDQAVDVVKFEGLSNWRDRVSCTINDQGITAEKTSDGKPHLQLFTS